MGSYIASATSNIRSIVEEIVVSEKSDVRLALIEYRDHPPQVRRNQKEKNNLKQGVFSLLLLGCDIRYTCT